MSLVEMKESIQNAPIVAIVVAHPHDKFLVCDGEGYTKLFQFTEKSFVFEEKYDLSSYKGILAADFSDTMNFWLIGFDNATVKGWPFDDLNGSPVFEFSTYPCALTTIRAGFDQDVFIAADDYTIRLIDVLRNREKILYHGHTNLIIDISVCKGCDRWASLQYNGDVYVWVHNGSTQATIKPPKISHGPVSRLPRLIQKNEEESHGTVEPMMTIYEKGRKQLLL
jgi:hypothetical protein